MQHLMNVKVKLWRSGISISNDVSKEALWKKWKHEYIVALTEKQNVKYKDKTFRINVDDVVMIKGEEKNREHWKIGIVNHLYIGKDDIIRVA